MAKQSMTSCRNNGKVTSEQIRRHIEQTRIEMDQTLSELQERLEENPVVHSIARFALLLKHRKKVAAITGSALLLTIVGLKIFLHYRR